MLSFFRTKSSEATVDKIIDDTKNLALKVDETIDNTNMDTKSNNNDTDQSLLKSLGYHNDQQLRETIFGIKFESFIYCLPYVY